MIEHLLCDACESRFSALEDNAKRVFYGGYSPIRLHLPLVKDPLFRTDYKKLKLFQLSILWRAAEAKGEFFAAVTLLDADRSRLRDMLLSANPGSEDEYPCAMTRLVVSSHVEELQRYMEFRLRRALTRQ